MKGKVTTMEKNYHFLFNVSIVALIITSIVQESNAQGGGVSIWQAFNDASSRYRQKRSQRARETVTWLFGEDQSEKETEEREKKKQSEGSSDDSSKKSNKKG